MRQTENYKNVKKLNKKVPASSARGYRGDDRSDQDGSRSVISSLGIASSFGSFGPQIEEFITHNFETLKNKYGGDFKDLRATATRYAKDYPVMTVVGATAIGLAAGLAWVGYNSSAQSKR